MEDALVLHEAVPQRHNGNSLNPCFNGRCTRTNHTWNYQSLHENVLILVLMEDALVQWK